MTHTNDKYYIMKFTFLFKTTKPGIVTNEDGTNYNSFITTETTEEMTLDEVVKKTKATSFGIADDYGHSYRQSTLDEVAEFLASRPKIIYYVFESGSRISFNPQVKTKEEMQRFGDAVRGAGLLD